MPKPQRIALLIVCCLLSCACNRSIDRTRTYDFLLPMVLQAEGRDSLQLSDLRGNAVVIEFWATWCGPCIANIDHWNEVHDECQDLPVHFLAITGEDAATVREFTQEKPIHGWLGLDLKGAAHQTFRVESIPRTIILNAEGRVVAETHPSQLSRTFISRLIDR